MKKMFMAVIALMMTISASAQFYIYCSDGNVIKVDSISMIAPGGTDTPNPSAGIGVFSVSDSKQVTFSPGNLHYHPANDKWRFAESQTDYIGEANNNISETYYGWLDLFGWSTSATNFGVSTSQDYTDYLGSFVDWGTNKIGNDAPNRWRTLTSAEWDYLLNGRPYANWLKGGAQVNGVNGLILLPDNWTCPSGVTFKSGFYVFENEPGYDGESGFGLQQTFTAEQWSMLKNSGAVFLPAAGMRVQSYIALTVQYGGAYWSATECDDAGGEDGYTADNLIFVSSGCSFISYPRCYGMSVRLVKDL